MSTRKRPLDSRSRGQSPPDKRNRLPERSGSFQDRYADPGNPTFPSPPRSRKNSLTGLPPNVPTGPAPKTKLGLRIDSYRPGRNREDPPFPSDQFRGAGSFIRTDDLVMSPASMGSGASTPVHNAPPAPSMLPLPGASSNANTLQGQQPLTMASLRTLQLRKQAIANDAKSNGIVIHASSSSDIVKLQRQLEASQTEIQQLRKDRDDMMIRLENLESLSTRVDGISDQMDQLRQSPEPTNLQVKVDALEKLDMPAKLSRFVELITLPKKISEVISSVAEVDRTVKEMQAHVNTIQSGTDQTTSQLNTEIVSLKSWKEAQSKNPTLTKDEMRNEVLSAVETAVKVSQTDNTAWRASVETHLGEATKSTQTALVGNRSFIDFKASQERINQNISEQLSEIRTSDRRTFGKLEKMDKSITATIDELEKSVKDKVDDVRDRVDDVWYEFDQYVGPVRSEAKDTDHTLVERVKMLESDQTKFGKDCKQLRSSQEDLQSSLEELNASHGKLNTTLEKLSNSPRQLSDQLNLPKRNAPRSLSPGFNKVGVPVSSVTNESLNKIDTELTQFKEDLEAFQGRLTNVELVPSKHDELATQVNDLSKEVSRLDLAVKETNKPLDNVAASESGSSALADTEVLQIQRELKEASENIAQLDSGLQAVEETIHTHANLIGGLGEEVPILFREKFDPLKQEVGELSVTMKGVSEGLNSNIAALKAELADQSAQSNAMKAQQTQLTSIFNTAKSLKDQVDKLETSFAQEISIRERGTQGIMEQIATKVGLGDVNPQLDALKVALQSLEHRYENITTDHLHQGMVHWFNQNYPTQGNLIAQVNNLQQDLTGLQPLIQQVVWMQQMAPQLQGLLQSATELPQLPQMRAKADKASNDAQSAIARTDESKRHIESIQTSLGTLQTAFNDLSRDTTSALKAEAIVPLENAVAELRTGVAEIKQSSENLVLHVNQGFKDEEEARVNLSKEIRSTATAEHDNRVIVETRMKESSNALAKRVKTIETSVNELRHDFDTVNEDVIEPHKEFFCLQGMTAVSVAELQHTVEKVNRNTGNRNPIPIAWEHDFNNMQQPSGKGKGRKDK